jgi:multidrug resistance protein MdtO
MAPPAADAGQGVGAWLFRQLAPEHGRLAFAAKLAAACAVTAGAAVFYRTPEPAVAAYLAFFVNARDRTTSLILELLLPILVGIILFIVLLTAAVVLDHPAWRLVAMALLSFGFLFLASASKLKPLAGIFGLLVGYALDKLGGVQLGEEATRGLLYGWLFVAMPGAASLVLNFALGLRPRRMATQALAERLELAADVLGRSTAPRRAALAATLGDGGAELRHWLALARKELGARPRDLDRLDQAVSSTLEILAAVQLLVSSDAIAATRFAPLAATLREMAAILRRGGFPVEIEAVATDRTGVSALAEDVLAAIDRALAGFADASPPTSAPDKPKAKPKGGFFAPDAFTNPVHLKFAFKITLAATGCYLLYSVLDWPGIHTCFLTCYIVGLGTVAESVEKLALRLSGAAVGAILGLAALLFVMPHAVSLGDLLLVVFLGALGSGYVAAGSPRISYVGFQMAFAFLLCTVQGPAPAFDMKTVRDRLIGIAIGNAAVYLVSTRMWPSSVAGRIDRALADALRALGKALLSAPHVERPRLASGVYARAETIEADLSLARYEPPLVRAPAPWREAREAGLEQLVRLQTAALAAGEIASASDLAARLNAVAGRLETAAPSAATVSAPPDRHPETLAEIIGDALERLEAALPGLAEGARP